jgi:hypothetical protein
MNIAEMEAVIRRHRVMMQEILCAALTLEKISTLGGKSCIGYGAIGYGGGSGDPAHLLDRAMSVTRHIRDGERRALIRWLATNHIDPHKWPRLALAFWHRVPVDAASDMARVTAGVV